MILIHDEIFPKILHLRLWAGAFLFLIAFHYFLAKSVSAVVVVVVVVVETALAASAFLPLSESGPEPKEPPDC